MTPRRCYNSPISSIPNKLTIAGRKGSAETELALLALELSRRFHGACDTGSRRAYPPKRAPLIVKRLKFLLKALEMIRAGGSPGEKIVIGLIGECLKQLYPERRRPSVRQYTVPRSRIRTYL
jgi:hypothetical protein